MVERTIEEIASGFIDALVRVLQSRRFRFTSEAELQEGIAKTLDAYTIDHRREHCLDKNDRLDFYIAAPRVAVEVKIDGSLSDLTRQVHRYAQNNDVAGIVIVTSLSRLTDLPSSINHKPVRVVHLLGSVL